MRTGVMLGTAGDPGAVAPEARRAEQLGFDLVAAGEHVFFHGPAANAFVTLAAAAAVTKRIRLLSALTILPLYPMAMAAKLASTLDLISRGRFDLGVGGEFPDFSSLADRYLLHGDPDRVVARLAEYHAAGAETVIFSPACAPERHADMIALFAEAVRPRLPGAAAGAARPETPGPPAGVIPPG